MTTLAQQSSPAYIPTYLNGKTDLIAFYNQLSSLVHSIPNHNVLIIGGDMKS